MIRHPFQQISTQKNIRISSLPNHRAHPPENRRAHPPENHRLIVNPSARPDQVQGGGGGGGTAAGLPSEYGTGLVTTNLQLLLHHMVKLH
ncbi:hypothetical protein SO802_024307 [Lithocarpus litseifolius]|uniref:Uncharacterized protein n=1 Tax=Lithocarpus litseifolius TaxID=425828 RepID=A0AAW2CBT3_9ROSI